MRPATTWQGTPRKAGHFGPGEQSRRINFNKRWLWSMHHARLAEPRKCDSGSGDLRRRKRSCPPQQPLITSCTPRIGGAAENVPGARASLHTGKGHPPPPPHPPIENSGYIFCKSETRLSLRRDMIVLTRTAPSTPAAVVARLSRQMQNSTVRDIKMPTHSDTAAWPETTASQAHPHQDVGATTALLSASASTFSSSLM